MPPSVLNRPLPAPGSFYAEEELCETAKNIRALVTALLAADPKVDGRGGGRGEAIASGRLLFLLIDEHLPQPASFRSQNTSAPPPPPPSQRRVLLCDIMLVRNYRLDVEHQHLTDCINKQLIDLCKPDNPRTDFGDRAPKWVHMSPPKVVAKREARSVDGVPRSLPSHPPHLLARLVSAVRHDPEANDLALSFDNRCYSRRLIVVVQHVDAVSESWSGGQ